MENNKHYICTGNCGGVSMTPDTCHATDCPKQGQPFQECSCDRPEHKINNGEEGFE